VLFVGLSIVLAALAVDVSGQREFDETLDRSTTTPGTDTSAPADEGAAAEQAPAEDPLADLDQ